MKSTGEVLGVDYSYKKALLKAFIAGGYKLDKENKEFSFIKQTINKKPALKIVKKLYSLGFFIMATWGTHKFLEKKWHTI